MDLMVVKAIVFLLILLIPGAWIFCVLLFPLLGACVIIRIREKRTLARTVEWSDAKRRTPICFILKCPHCHEEQWVRKEELYRSTNGTQNNHRCSKCGLGAQKKMLWADKEKEKQENIGKFKPRNPGWKSIGPLDF